MPAPISRVELEDLIARDAALVVEALGADYFADGHLPGAVSLPSSADDHEVRAFAASIGRQVVVYGSRGGVEAYELATRIEAITGVGVAVYEAGKEDWAEAGLPIDRPPVD